MKPLAFLLAVAVAAAALHTQEHLGGLPSKTIICADRQITAKQIGRVADASMTLIQNKQEVTSSTGIRYPHRYLYKDEGVKLSSACEVGDELYEYPIEPNGIWNGGNVQHIPDRIVLKAKWGKKAATYCGLITHTGAAGNGFLSCSG